MSEETRSQEQELSEILQIRREKLAALQEEAQHSFEERKRNAREEGERAGTRLLLPMMMMLAVVMVLILVPACFSFAGM